MPASVNDTPSSPSPRISVSFARAACIAPPKNSVLRPDLAGAGRLGSGADAAGTAGPRADARLDVEARGPAIAGMRCRRSGRTSGCRRRRCVAHFGHVDVAARPTVGGRLALTRSDADRVRPAAPQRAHCGTPIGVNALHASQTSPRPSGRNSTPLRNSASKNGPRQIGGAPLLRDQLPPAAARTAGSGSLASSPRRCIARSSSSGAEPRAAAARTWATSSRDSWSRARRSGPRRPRRARSPPPRARSSTGPTAALISAAGSPRAPSLPERERGDPAVGPGARSPASWSAPRPARRAPRRGAARATATAFIAAART